MKAVKKQFEYQLKEEKLSLQTPSEDVYGQVYSDSTQTTVPARQLLALGVMRADKDGRQTTEIEKKNSNTVDKEGNTII